MKRPQFSLSLHGLSVQVLLWSVLPITILMIVFSLSGISSHQSSMQAMAVEEKSSLALALARAISVERENYALSHQIPTRDVSIEDLNIAELFDMNHPHSVTTFALIDRSGQLLYGKGSVPLQGDLAAWPGVTEALTGESGVIFTSELMHSDVVAYTSVPETTWSLMIREAWHSTTDPLIRFEQVMPFILLSAVIVSFLILFFGLRYVAQPLRDLGQRANQIGQGDFTAVTQPIGGVKEIEDLRQILNTMAQRIHNDQATLQDYLGDITKAQEEERAHLGRELHDETVQTLIALGHKAQMVQRSFRRAAPQTEEQIDELRQMIAQAIEEVRRFSHALRPHYLEELGLTAALETLAQEAGAEFHVGQPMKGLTPEKELAIYRIAQEALNNARRHAEAQHISLNLVCTETDTKLAIMDDGKGFQIPDQLNDLTQTGHFGLVGMRERAQMVNGKLSVKSVPGQGTNIEFTVQNDRVAL
jgi:signal transduction histidine kinase